MGTKKRHPLYDILEARGVKAAAPDHWIYSEGPSIIFSPRTSQASKSKDSVSTSNHSQKSTDSRKSKSST